MVRKLIELLSLVVVMPAILLFIVFELLMDDFCQNDIHLELFSQDKEHKAVLFTRDCGATTGYSSQLSIIKGHETLDNEGGNVFVMDNHPNVNKLVINWLSDSALHVSSNVESRVYKAEKRFSEITIDYNLAKEHKAAPQQEK